MLLAMSFEIAIGYVIGFADCYAVGYAFAYAIGYAVVYAVDFPVGFAIIFSIGFVFGISKDIKCQKTIASSFNIYNKNSIIITQLFVRAFITIYYLLLFLLRFCF